jgi:hypothetical protein
VTYGFGGFLRGRPPLQPLARAAAALAALTACPPLRPSETAAGFLDIGRLNFGDADHFNRQQVGIPVGHGFGRRANGHTSGVWVYFQHGESQVRFLDAGWLRELYDGSGGQVRHGRTIPKRLGYVK